MIMTKDTLVPPLGNLLQLAKILFFMSGKRSRTGNYQSLFNPMMISIVNLSSLNVNQKMQEHGVNITTQETLGS